MNESHKDIIIAVLVTLIWVFFVGWTLYGYVMKVNDRLIEDCINAGNRPIPCVEAVLPDQ